MAKKKAKAIEAELVRSLGDIPANPIKKLSVVPKPPRKKSGPKPKREKINQAFKDNPVIVNEVPSDYPEDFSKLRLSQQLYVINRIENGMTKGGAAAGSGYTQSGQHNNFNRIGKDLETSANIKKVMDIILEQRGLTRGKIAEEVAWGIEQSKKARVYVDPKTKQIIQTFPDMKSHQAYVKQLQSLHGISDKVPGLAVQINNDSRSSNGKGQTKVEPLANFIEGSDEGTIRELLEALETEAGERESS